LRHPNHIILDFFIKNHNKTEQYWVMYFLDTRRFTPKFLYSKTFKRKQFALTPSTGARLTLFQNPEFFSLFTKTHITNYLLNFVNANFLRKERLYTKLKYSRSPAYDIVSGGSAAILAGLLGFLTSEKFGIELVDSGDFYYLWMYTVFLVFSIRPLITVSSAKKSFRSVLNLTRVFNFYNTILLLVIRCFK